MQNYYHTAKYLPEVRLPFEKASLNPFKAYIQRREASKKNRNLKKNDSYYIYHQ